MKHVKHISIVWLMVVFIIGCAGQPVRNSAPPAVPDGETAQGNTAEQWSSENQYSQTFYERNRKIIADALIVALVVTEICLFWYLADSHHHSHHHHYVGPVLPVWY